MRTALELAAKAGAPHRPNPDGGALVSRDGEVVGRAFTSSRRPTRSAAIDAAGEQARGATLYVTLEPCQPHRADPAPARSRLIETGIRPSVIGMQGPQPSGWWAAVRNPESQRDRHHRSGVRGGGPAAQQAFGQTRLHRPAFLIAKVCRYPGRAGSTPGPGIPK